MWHVAEGGCANYDPNLEPIIPNHTAGGCPPAPEMRWPEASNFTLVGQGSQAGLSQLRDNINCLVLGDNSGSMDVSTTPPPRLSTLQQCSCSVIFSIVPVMSFLVTNDHGSIVFGFTRSTCNIASITIIQPSCFQCCLSKTMAL